MASDRSRDGPFIEIQEKTECLGTDAGRVIPVEETREGSLQFLLLSWWTRKKGQQLRKMTRGFKGREGVLQDYEIVLKESRNLSEPGNGGLLTRGR